MRLFKKSSNETETIVLQKNAAKNSAFFVIGALISALAFNLFFVPYNFVSGSLGGIAVILNKVLSLNSTLVLLVGNLIFIIISIICLGFRKSLMSVIGASIYTIFVYLTEDIPGMINFSLDDPLLYVLAAGIVGGFGEGLVYKSGFNTGGTSIPALVIQKYTKRPLGEILQLLSIIIILSGGFVFGYTSIMYAILITVLTSTMIDKIMIGIGSTKQLLIHTDKEEEVKNFIIEIIESGVTELSSKGAFLHKKHNMLMCVVPTEKYSLLTSAIKEIDPDAFIVVSDCYEVLGGTRKKLLFNEDDM